MSGGLRRQRLGGRVGGWANLVFVALAGLLAVGGFAMLLDWGQGGEAGLGSRVGVGALPLPAFAPAHDDAAAPRQVSLPVAAPMDYSVPVRLDFDQAAIHADVLAVGLDGDSAGTTRLDQQREAAWNALGPTPGELGASVVDVRVAGAGSAARHGAASILGGVKPGQTIRVTRADHSIAVFTVDAVTQARSGSVPSLIGNEPTPYAALRLVAFTGGYLQQQRGYTEDTIVFAHLSAARSAAPTGRAN